MKVKDPDPAVELLRRFVEWFNADMDTSTDSSLTKEAVDLNKILEDAQSFLNGENNE